MAISVISRKDLIDERHLKGVSKSQVNFVLSYLDSVRVVNPKGWSGDKENMLKNVYPADVYWKINEFLNKFKDPVERAKASERILNQFNKFKLRR